MTDLMPVPQANQWSRLKALVLDSVSSPITKRVYNLGLDEFFAWFSLEPRLGFTKATVAAWRVALEASGLPAAGQVSAVVPFSVVPESRLTCRKTSGNPAARRPTCTRGRSCCRKSRRRRNTASKNQNIGDPLAPKVDTARSGT